MVPCWSESVVSALQFLAGESKGIPESFKKKKIIKLSFIIYILNDAWWYLGLCLVSLFPVSWCNDSAYWLRTFCGVQGTFPAMEMDRYDALYYFPQLVFFWNIGCLKKVAYYTAIQKFEVGKFIYLI